MPLVSIGCLLEDERWVGKFTPRGIPLVMACRLTYSIVLFFSVTRDSRLQMDGVVIDPLLAW